MVIGVIARKVRGKSPKTAHTVKMTESYFLEKAILKDSSANTDYCNSKRSARLNSKDIKSY